MKLLQRSFILAFTFFLFAGTVGFNVFEHICKKDGVTLSYFVNTGDDQCKQKHGDHEELAPCCHRNEPSKKDGCCSNEVDYLKLKIDAKAHEFVKYFIPTPNGTLTETVDLSLYTPGLFDHYTSDYVNPPPIKSKFVRIKKQVWVI